MKTQVDPSDISRSLIPHAEEYYDRLLYELDPLGGYRLRPNQRLAHVTINEQGYRGAAFTGQETLLLLGDSVTFGVGASSDEEIFARYLEHASGYRVADVSVRAYRVFQHYLQLPRLLERLPRVRQVLVWFGYADLLYWVTTGGCVEGAFQFEWKYRARGSSGKGWLWQRRPPGSVEVTKSRVRETGTLEALAAHVSAYLNGMHDICAMRGIGVSLLAQPFIRSRPSRDPLRHLADLYDEKTAQKCGESWYAIAPRFLARVHAGLRLSDGARWLDGQELVTERDFLDQAHVNEAGLRRLAASLVEKKFIKYHALTDMVFYSTPSANDIAPTG